MIISFYLYGYIFIYFLLKFIINWLLGVFSECICRFIVRIISKYYLLYIVINKLKFFFVNVI